MELLADIICQYSLPDGYVPRTAFRAKGLPTRGPAYFITEDGVLEHGGAIVPFTGEITMIVSNLLGVSIVGYVTENDAPYFHREYEARFLDGTLLNIILVSSAEDGLGSLPQGKHITHLEWMEGLRKR
jgi:hypothetical protein